MRDYIISPSIANENKRNDDNRAVHVYEFSNNMDTLRFINEKLASGVEYKHIRDCNNNFVEGSDSYHWFGKDCKDFNQALHFLQFGNPNYTQKFIEGLNEIMYTGDDDRTTFMDVEGFCYDMGAVVSGEPECCLNMTMPDANQHVEVYVCLDFNCGIDSDMIKNRGIAIANLLATLLTKNYFVDLKFFGNRNFSSHEMCQIYNVSCKSLCLAELAFYCTPEFFRMISLVLDGMCSGDPKKCGQCQGYTRLAMKEKMIKTNAFFIPGGYDDQLAAQLKTPKSADEYIKKLWNEYQTLGYSPWLIKDSTKERDDSED